VPDLAPLCCVCVLLLAACAHTAPGPTEDQDTDGPRTTTPLIRLTYDLGRDLAPAWRADGSGLLYAFQRPGPDDLDGCLAELPPGGGTRRSEKCPLDDLAQDSVNVLGTPAISAGGRLAWVEARNALGRVSPATAEIRVGSLAVGDRGTIVRTLPYLAQSGNVHATISHLHWLSETALTYVGDEVQYVGACQGCKLDSLVIGREIARLDLAAGNLVTVIPGTAEASSVWPSPDGLTIYYTIAGDSRVFRHLLSSGGVTTVHDFGPAGIARDATLSDSVLAAIVGGRVSYGPISPIGPVQVDSGGLLYHVNLTTGVATPLGLPGKRFRSPSLRPGAQQIVVEAVDSTGALIADLYLFDSP
jgi:hypothetical protein